MVHAGRCDQNHTHGKRCQPIIPAWKAVITMVTVVSDTTSITYKKIVKPILFKQHPDVVHGRMLRTGSACQRSVLVRAAMRWMWAYQNEAALSQHLHGVTFCNPIGLSAGFDKNFELPPTMKAIGFGFMEGGSITYHTCKGNPRPWFYRLPRSQSIVVHVGLANEGAAAVLDRVQAYPSQTFDSFPLNISVAKTNSKLARTDEEAVKDYIGSLELIKKTGVGSLVTLNISCPNTYGGEPFTTPERLALLLDEVDAVGLKQPVFIKMPINLAWPDFRSLLHVAVAHHVAGVTIGNLSKQRDNLQDTLPASVQGGLSGKPTYALSNELIARTYRSFGDRLTIIGVGGVFSAEDAYTKIKLGASLVELITGLIYEGPALIGQINRGLVRLLQADGYSTVAEAIGSGNRIPAKSGT
jgi:dihydroorotate dehydrogenase